MMPLPINIVPMMLLMSESSSACSENRLEGIGRSLFKKQSKGILIMILGMSIILRVSNTNGGYC